MGYNWKAVRDCNSPEEAFYRLIGEMLHRNATPRDLLEVRDFLLTHSPGIDAWVSLGEALHITTHGADAGFRLWTAWSRSLRGDDFELLEHARRWKNFGAGASLEEETAADEDRHERHLFQPLDEDSEDSAPLEESGLFDDTGWTGNSGPTDVFQVQRRTPEHRGRGTRTGDLLRESAVIGRSETQILSLIPPGERAIKLFGRVFEAAGEAELLELFRRGILPAVEVEHDGKFIPVLLHPDFESLARVMRQEALRILRRDDSGDISSPSGPVRHPPKP